MNANKSYLRQALAPLASLRLTIVLLAASMVLIFAGTLAQRNQGIWSVMDEYFRAAWVWIPLQIFVPNNVQVGGGFPFVGGAVLMGALLVNLLTSHALRWKLRWKRTGIFLIHASLVLLIVGEGITAYTAVETQMPIMEGQTISWSQDVREAELAVIDPGAEGEERESVIAIPQSRLERAERTGVPIEHPGMPFRIRVDRYMTNSALHQRGVRDGEPMRTAPQASAGFAQRFEAVERPEVSGVGEQRVNAPSAIITLLDGDRPINRYLVSTSLGLDPTRNLRQDVALPDGGTREISLRMRRHYKPYAVTLQEFHHDLYPGTNVPMNFASDIRLADPGANVDRELKIYMNNPLRYEGETFYQASYMPNDAGTVLQIVNNPGWTIPYIACLIGAFGLTLHFCLSLTQFLMRRRKAAAKAQATPATPEPVA